MKKKFEKQNQLLRVLLKFLIMVKAVWIIVMASVLQVSAGTNLSYSQSVKMSIHLENADLEQVIWTMKKQTEFNFFYSSEDVRSVNKLNVEMKDATAETILDHCLKGSDLTYEIVNKVVIIKKSENNGSRLDNGLPAQTKVEQKKRLSGTVKDTKGLPLPGVTVVVKGTTLGTITDNDGIFSIEANPTDKLVFSFVGMESKTIDVGDQKTINVQLQEKANELEEVAVVAFGTQKKESVVAAITTIKPGNLKVPSSNLTTALAGRAAGIISYQRSGDPGSDDASFFIRGITTFGANTKPLILIDNIELATTDLAQLQPDDIESFSIMKDASATALYGARGANGVILVKTKKGQKGKLKTTFRLENSLSAPTRDLELADPITYMKLNNEAITTREPLGEHLYSEDKIYNTVSGSGSYIYPSTDWKSELLKNYTMNQRMNLSISGGGDLVTYYVAGSYTHDNGILKVDKRNNFNSNIKSNVYTFRSNITLNLTKTTQISSNFNGSFRDIQGPIYSGSEMYSLIMRSNPTLFPAYYPVDNEHQYTNHILFGNVQSGSSYYINPYAEMVKGYKESGRSNLSAQFELTQKFDFITQGLSARVLFNILRISAHSIARSYNPYWYSLGSYDKKENTYSIVNVNPDNGTDYLGYSSTVANPTANTYFEAAVNYYREFGKHTLSGLLVYQLHNNVNLGLKISKVLFHTVMSVCRDVPLMLMTPVYCRIKFWI